MNCPIRDAERRPGLDEASAMDWLHQEERFWCEVSA
ncbi:hypothetical protein F0726_01261 [Acidithiobacillus caldus]|nr:hypothetical protein F0726_01261 [Acidithiobacillus caldus]